MAEIIAKHGEIILLDEQDAESLGHHRWYVNGKYVVRCEWLGKGKNKVTLIHREIMGVKSGDRLQVDHINGNPLDNRRANLRICTRSQNGMNRGKQANNTSGFKGVIWRPKERKWAARIGVDGKKIDLGYFQTKAEAAAAYDAASKRVHGEFANSGVECR